MTNNPISETFKYEARELLTQLEDALLELEENASSIAAIEQVFRTAHTLKGSGAMAGFTAVAEMAHELESAFDMVKSGCIDVSPELISLALWVADFIKTAINENEIPDEAALQRVRAFVHTLKQICGVVNAEAAANVVPADPVLAEAAATSLYFLRFIPSADLFGRGISPMGILSALSEYGPLLKVAHLGSVPALEDMEPEECHLGWDMLLSSSADVNEIRDAFIFVEGESEVHLEAIAAGRGLDLEGLNRLRPVVETGCDLSVDEARSEIAKALAKPSEPEPSQSAATVLVHAESVSTSSTPQRKKESTPDRSDSSDNERHDFLRVRADRLDTLINLVGELVTLQGRLASASLRLHDADLTSINEESERLRF